MPRLSILSSAGRCIRWLVEMLEPLPPPLFPGLIMSLSAAAAAVSVVDVCSFKRRLPCLAVSSMKAAFFLQARWSAPAQEA